MLQPSAFSQHIKLALAFLIYGLGSIIIYVAWQLEMQTFPLFVGLFALSVLTIPPTFAFSPLTILYAYYAAWFVIAPAFAGKYQNVLHLPEYRAVFPLAYSVFGLGVWSILLGEFISRTGFLSRPPVFSAPGRKVLTFSIILLFAASSVCIALIVQYSGGLAYWMENPGRAFLNRRGTGVFVVGSHFFSLALAVACGFMAKRYGNKWPLLLFLVWLLATAPVHGSKLQIGTLFLVAFTPWIVSARFYSLSTIALGILGVGVFLGGMYFRNQDILSSTGRILSTLNYFTVVENLAISLRDYPPGWIQTWFLPFNKIGIELGIVNPAAYYDMNHMLTDKYYPARWAMRATEQWPVETDLYLNFSFYFGLPIMVLFFAFHGWLFEFARRANSSGVWFAAIMISLAMISHLRGSLYNHTDFVMLPYILIMAILMRGWVWDPAVNANVKPAS